MYAANRWISSGCRTALILMTAGMTACGGGGGGGGAAPAALAVIDTGNAETIASEVLVVGFDVSDVGMAAGGGGILATDGGSNALAVNMAGRRTIQAAGQAQPSASYGPEQDECLINGTLTLSGDLANTDTLTRNDRITAVFAACDDGDGAIYNGRMRFDILSFSGDLYADQYQLKSDITLTNLAITENERTVTANGNMTLDLNLMTLGLDSYLMGSPRLEVNSGNSSWVLHDMVVSIDDDYRGAEWLTITSASGSLESSNFEGRVDFGTPTDFVASDENYPHTGVLRIDGANGSSILVTVIDEESLQLAIDVNGDGTVDETRLMDWTEVDSL